jgi:hypothetical protein
MPTPLINGINYSWANITLTLFGVPVVGITKIEYKRKQKKENNYGFGSQPVSRGYGNYEYEGSIEIYLDEWKRIIASAPSNDPLLISPFDIQVTYSGRGITADKDVLRSVEFMEDNFTANQGDTKLMVTVPLIIGAIDRSNA